MKTQLELIECVPMSMDGSYHFTKAQRDYLLARAQGMEFAASRIRTLERQVEKLEDEAKT
jgi:polyhydroxyalkanoate synthesis regulator phasin